MLERFTNTDKHRLIHAATTNLIDAPAINFSRVIPVAVSDVTYPPTGQAVTDGTEIARFKGDMGLNLAPQPDGRFAVLNSSVQVEAGFQAGTLFGEPGKEDTRAREFGPSSRKPAPTRIRARKRAPRHVARRRCLRFALAVLKRVPPSRASARRSPGAHKEDQPLSITPDEPSPEARLSSNLQIAIGHIQAAVWAMKRITTNDDPAHGITDADWGFLPGFCTEIL
jgi:hypothetical protein